MVTLLSWQTNTLAGGISAPFRAISSAQSQSQSQCHGGSGSVRYFLAFALPEGVSFFGSFTIAVLMRNQQRRGFVMWKWKVKVLGGGY